MRCLLRLLPSLPLRQDRRAPVEIIWVAPVCPLPPYPAQLLLAVHEQRITHLVAVPTLWRALVASPGRRAPGSGSLAPTLRLAVSSGEPLVPMLLSDLQAALPEGCGIWNLYGSTEVAADCTALDCTAWRPEPQQLWQSGQAGQQGVPVGGPISNTLIAVLAPPRERDSGSDAALDGGTAAGVDAGTNYEAPSAQQRAMLPVGTVGEVAVVGACLAAGCLPCTDPSAGGAPSQLQRRRQPEARFVRLPARQLQAALASGAAVAAAGTVIAELTPAAAVVGAGGGPLEGGGVRAFLTGDLGWLDAAGCLHLAGRRDLQVKVAGGVRLDLTEVEVALSRHPAVATAAARLWQLPAGPVLAVYVELSDSSLSTGSSLIPPTSAELQEWCRQQLPPAAVPQQVQVLGRLPRSAAGKLQRSELPGPEAGGGGGATARREELTATLRRSCSCEGEAFLQSATRGSQAGGSSHRQAGLRLLQRWKALGPAAASQKAIA